MEKGKSSQHAQRMPGETPGESTGGRVYVGGGGDEGVPE